MRIEELGGTARDDVESGRWVAGVALAVVVAGVLVGANWFTNISDEYRGSCTYLGGSQPIVDDGYVPLGPISPTPAAAIEAFASDPDAHAAGEPVPSDGWHERNPGRWVRDLSDDQFLEVSVAGVGGGWVVTSATSCGRLP